MIILEPELLTWADFEDFLQNIPNKQVDGPKRAYCETGELYQTFFLCLHYREGDRAHVEHDLVLNLMGNLIAYFGSGNTVYWRIRPEMEDVEAAIVTKYADDGPEIDYSTDKRCFTEKGWRLIKARCRVFCPSNQMVTA